MIMESAVNAYLAVTAATFFAMAILAFLALRSAGR